MKPLISRNPANQEVLKSFESLSPDSVSGRLGRAESAYRAWRLTSFAERSLRMSQLGGLLTSRREPLARLMALEMGKPISGGLQEVDKCASTCHYFAENAERFLRDETMLSEAKSARVSYQPIGAVLAVMPWNFPLWQVFRFAVPGLMAGNVGLLKHASNVPQCAVAIEDLFREAGFPEGVFQTLLIGSSAVEAVIRDRRVAAVTLTGSNEAGARVAAVAGESIKKTVLELGGSDPFIVMPSADLARAAEVAVQARTVNSGQSCIAAKRFIVHREIAAQFETAFVERMRALKVGDPLDPMTQVGPLATPDILETLERQVRESVAAGATLLTGGRRIGQTGNFYEPTVLTGVPADCPAAREELFGPVASVFAVASIEEAIELANGSRFGLGASVWTRDSGEKARSARDLESGCVFFNGMVASDPRLPFGGVKESGYGRELGPLGIREFTNAKTICDLS